MAGFGFGTNIASEGIFQAFGGRGKKPKIPEAPKIDLGEVLSGLIKASSGNLPEINELVSAVNLFVSDEAQRLAERFIPGFTAAQEAFMDTAGAYARGEQPKAITDALRRESAAIAQGQGTAGSYRLPGGFARAGHLGRTVRQVEEGLERGSRLASEATARARAFAPDIASPFSFLFRPSEALDAERFNEQNRFQTELAKNISDSFPSPSQLGWATAAQSDFDQTLSTIASFYSGGAIGGGGMMGGMGGGGGGGGAGSGGGGGGSFWNLFSGGGGGGGMTIDTFGNPVGTSRARPNYG